MTRDLPAAELDRELARERRERRALVDGDIEPVAIHLSQLISALRYLDDQADDRGPNRGRDLHRAALRWAVGSLLDEHSDAADEAHRIAANLTRRRPATGQKDSR